MPAQNPFDVHSQLMAQYQEMLAPQVNGMDGNYVIYAGNQYPAVVSHFQVQQMLAPNGGGFTPMLMGQAIIQKNILPAGINFRSGQFITAAQVGGSVRQCQIESVDDEFGEYRLNLWDKSQKA